VLFGAWLLFILAQILPGTGSILRQGLTFLAFPSLEEAGRSVPLLKVLWTHLLSLCYFAPIPVAASGLGTVAMERLFKGPLHWLERFVLAQGIGLGILALFLLAAFSISGAGPAAALVLVGTGLVLSTGHLLRRSLVPPPKTSPEKPDFLTSLTPVEWVLLGLIAYSTLLHLMGALGPETFYDSLVYHLGLPHLYRVHGSLLPVEGLLHSGFPQNMEMLYLLGIIFKGEGPAKLIHWWMMVLTIFALYGFGRTACSRRTGLVACALFTGIPVAAAAVWHTGVELGVALWTLLGAWTLMRGFFALSGKSGRTRDGQHPVGDAIPWLLISGVFHGLAMGAKYTGFWSYLAAGVVLTVWLWRRSDLPAALRLSLGVLWGLAGALTLAPWLIKNTAHTGNPVYPFLIPLFGCDGPVPDMEAFRMSARGHFWHGGLAHWRTWVLMPWQLLVKGRSPYSFIGPVLAAFLPLAVLVRRASFPFGWLLLAFGVQYIAWSASTSMVRLLIPALPLFCLFAAHLLTRLGKDWGPWLPWAVVVLAAWNISWNAAMLNEKEIPGVVLGYETRADFLDREHHSYHAPYYDMARFAVKDLPRGARVLIVGDARRYPIPRDTVASSVFDQSPFLEAVRRAATAREVWAALRGDGVTHLLLSIPETQRLLGKRIRAMTDAQRAVMDDFWERGVIELRRNKHGVILYALKPDEKW